MKITGAAMKCITPERAARILGLTRSRVRQFVASGELRAAGMFGTTTIFLEREVLQFKEKREGAKKNGNKKAGK